jgi:hypothetical protein
MSAPHLENIFRNLRVGRYELKSPQTRIYNCIAWAAKETHRRWWPIGGYWPLNVPREETVECFIMAFGTLEYEPCTNAKHEKGFEKVAIYIDSSGTPTHMARQLESGRWTSKLGSLEDIEHETLHEVEGDDYGRATKILRRRKAIVNSTSWLRRLLRKIIPRFFLHLNEG